MKYTHHVVIDRNKWLNGRYDADNKIVAALLDELEEKGKEARCSLIAADTALWDTSLNAGCCLGHAMHQIEKLTYADLSYMPLPSDLEESCVTKLKTKLFVSAVGQDTLFSSQAATLNDRDNISDSEREKKLIKHFATKSVKLSFKGKYRTIA